MYDPAARRSPNLAFLWPAVAAASMSEMAGLLAKQFGDLAVGPDAPLLRKPEWATPHTIALTLKSVWLRDFSTNAERVPTLLCAPFALHGAAMVDFAPGHSLVAALRDAGLQRLFVTDWRSATPDMRFLGIDDYLADLNVLVDDIGAPVDLVGVCQGGWLALIYAARFPGKMRKLVLAGAPIDVHAVPSALSMLAEGSPLTLFHELVRLGDGLVPGRRVLKFWGPASVTAEDVRQILETEEQANSVAFRRLELAFQDWYAWTVDLPGPFFIETVEKLYRRNELATGRFVALGRRINLTAIRSPIFLLAARDDELVTPPQLFAAERLVGTPARHIQKTVAPCRHAGLFLSKRTLREVWPRIARWIDEPVHSVAQREKACHQNLSIEHV